MTVLLILWAIFGIGWAIVTICCYSLEDDYYSRKRRKLWARAILMTPVWPIYGAYLLVRKLGSVWEDSGFSESFKRLQQNLQKESNGKS